MTVTIDLERERKNEEIHRIAKTLILDNDMDEETKEDILTVAKSNMIDNEWRYYEIKYNKEHPDKIYHSIKALGFIFLIGITFLIFYYFHLFLIVFLE